MSFLFSKNGTILDPLIYSMTFYLEIHPECFLMSLHFLLHVVWTDLLFLTLVFLSSGSRMGEILPAPPPQLTQNSASACSLVQGTLISRVEYCNAFLGCSTLNLFLESIRHSAQSGLWKTGLHVAPLHKPAVASPCVEGTARSSLRSDFLRPLHASFPLAHSTPSQ